MPNNWSVTVELISVLCASCTSPFAIPVDVEQRRRNDGKAFYCPHGHQNTYTPSEQVKAEKTKLANLERDNKCLTSDRENLQKLIDNHTPSPEQQILLILKTTIKTNPSFPWTAETIAEVLGLDWDTAFNYLEHLEDTGRITNQGNIYTLAPTPPPAKDEAPPPPAKDGKKDTRTQRVRILEALVLAGPTGMPVGDLASALGLARSSVSATLSTLVHESPPKVVHLGPGTYALATPQSPTQKDQDTAVPPAP